MDFCDRYSRHFIGQGYNSAGHARDYLSGLTGTQRRENIETIENDVKGSNYQGMEQFISSSSWSHRDLMDEVARGADEKFGHDNDASLSIDENSFLKKARASVGVKRQWSGRAGKVENCQVAVFVSLGHAERYSLIDFELFLPEEWAKDSERCDKAKSQTGMAQYEVRVWQGWHHHMTLACLANLFMDETKNWNKEIQPLLSYRDITELLDYYLPRRHREEEEVHLQIRILHAACQRDLDRRQSHRTGIPPDINLTK
jgi:SRSO17 transposase